MGRDVSEAEREILSRFGKASAARRFRFSFRTAVARPRSRRLVCPSDQGHAKKRFTTLLLTWSGWWL